MVMSALRNSAAAGIMKYILFGLLILAVGGLVLMDVGGFFRNGVPTNDVAQVGSVTLSARSFDRSVRGQLGRIGIEPTEAYKLGLIDQLLATEIRTMLLEQGAQDYGISVGRDLIAKKIAALIAPMLQPGQSPQEGLNQILRSQGLAEEEFIASLHREMAANLLGQSLATNAAFATPDLLRDMDRYMGESRDVEYILFPDSEIKDVPTPSDAEIAEFYQTVRERFAQPELRHYTVLRLREDSLRKDITIPEDDVRKAYDDYMADHAQDVLYTVEQAIVPTAAQAKTLITAVKNGASLKAAVDQNFKNKNVYQPQKTALLETWSEALQPDLETAKEGDLIGPQESIQGWHVARVVKIEKAAARSYENLQADLRSGLEENLVRDRFDTLAAQIDDMAAAGAMPEEIAQEYKVLERITLPGMSAAGTNIQGQDVLKAHEDLRALVLQTGPRLRSSEISRMEEEEKGIYQALALEKIEPKSYPPLADVKTALIAQWMKNARQRENRAQLEKFMGSDGMAALARTTNKPVNTLAKITRSAENLPFPGSAETLFAAPAGHMILLETPNGLAAAQVKNITHSAPATAEKIQALQRTIEGQMADETVALTVAHLQKRKGAHVNQSLLRRLYGSTDSESE